MSCLSYVLTKCVSAFGGVLLLTCLWDFMKNSEIPSWQSKGSEGKSSGQKVPSATITQLALSPAACPDGCDLSWPLCGEGEESQGEEEKGTNTARKKRNQVLGMDFIWASHSG